MAITQTIATLPAVLNDSETFYEDIAIRNNSLVTVSFPSINTWATQANALAVEINDKAAQVAAQAVDGGYSQTYINTNFVGVNNAQTIAEIKTFSSSPIVPTPTTGTQAVNKDYVDSKPTLSIGAILNGYTIFNNCIVAFGGEFNRADYPRLWAYLQANPILVKTQAQWAAENTAYSMCGYFSSGNGTTTFRVPNLDKAFLRPDSRGIGIYQGDAIRDITGVGPSYQIGSDDSATSGAITYQSGSTMSVGSGPGATPQGRIQFNASNVVPTANENRPKNIAVLPLIVAK